MHARQGCVRDTLHPDQRDPKRSESGRQGDPPQSAEGDRGLQESNASSNHGETGLSVVGTKFDRGAGALPAHLEVNEREGEKDTEGVLTAP